MLSDSDLRHLNLVYSDALAARGRGADAEAALKAILDQSRVPSDDLVFDTHQSERPLPGHIFIAGPALSTSLPRLYCDVSGSGAHYNGMYGDATMLRNDSVRTRLLNVTQEAAPISEQIALCIQFLCKPQASHRNEVVAAIQRHLSSVLLTYPVLMHPGFVVPVARSGNIEYTSLVAALASSHYGALPRRSHFTAADFDADGALEQRLADFANHPCTVAGLNRSCARVHLSPKGLSISFSRDTALKALLRHPGPHQGFLGSVMELDDLSADPARARTLPFGAAGGNDPVLLPQLEAMLSASTMAACGMLHTTGGHLGSLDQSMWMNPVDKGFLQAMRRRMDLVGRTGSRFEAGLRASAARRVFLNHAPDVELGEVDHNVVSLAHGLADAGFVATPAAGARFIAHTVLGTNRDGDRLPRADTTAAVHFLKAVEALGGFGATDDAVLAELGDLKNAVETFPACHIDYRDQWLAACEAVQRERLMLTILRRPASEVRPLIESLPGGQAEFDFSGIVVNGAAAPSAPGAQRAATRARRGGV